MYRERFSGFRTKSRPCQCDHDSLEHLPLNGPCRSCACQRFRGISRSKYNAERCEGVGGKFHSKGERDYAFELDMQVKSKDIVSVKRQVPIRLAFDCTIDGREVHFDFGTYYVDFVVTHNDGRTEYIEYKGFVKQEWKTKWKVFEALYGHDPKNILTIQHHRRW